MRSKAIAEFAGRHKLATAICAAAIIIAMVYLGYLLVTAISNGFENAQVERLNKQAAGKQAEANKSLDQANAEAVDRKAEDKLRERTIEPQLEQATQNSQAARERARQAERNYEKSRTRPSGTDSRVDPDQRLLHERNCTDLRELYPGERIAGCEP